MRQLTIVFFDGECMLCNRLVQFIVRRNLKENIKFCSLQSARASSFFESFGKKQSINLDTMYFYSNLTFFQQSDAALEICSHLRFPWNLARVFKFIPQKMRDFLYRLLANSRYKLFGRVNDCQLLSEKESKRLIH